MDQLLTVLKYAGLILATVSSVWAATNVVSREVNGKKKLTLAGKISLALTLGGFLISISSTLLQDHQNKVKGEAAALKEIRKTNQIILAGQPLTSLQVQWKFDARNNFLGPLLDSCKSDWNRYHMEEVQGGTIATQANALYKTYYLYPFLGSIINDSVIYESSFLMLMSLDNTQSSVLPFGCLNDTVLYPGYNKETPFYRDWLGKQHLLLSGGISFSRDVKESAHFGEDITLGRTMSRTPFLTQKNDSVIFNWNLDPFNFMRCVDKMDPNLTLTANLPRNLKLLLLHNIKTVPFVNNNMAYSPEFDLWGEYGADKKIQNEILSHSDIYLTPNGLIEETSHYRLSKMVKKRLTSYERDEDIDWEEEASPNCWILTFEKVDD